MKQTDSYRIVIPARYASERLPAKALRDIEGRSLLEHVWRRASQSSARSVLIATDDERIEFAARSFGADVLMTDPAHPSGSDRIAECVDVKAWPDDDVIVNLQGDEPLMPCDCLDQVASLLAADRRADAASLFWPIDEAGDVENPNVVKVVVDDDGGALYFSRAPVPYARDHSSAAVAIGAGVGWKRHIGLYAYRAATLRRFTRSSPGVLEQVERLEQLRILGWGGRIRMARAKQWIPAGVDTLADLDRVRSIIRKNINKAL